MLAFLLFSVGSWLSIWGNRLYAKTRGRKDNNFEYLLKDAEKDKLNKNDLPSIKKTLLIVTAASVLLLIAILLKLDHFLQCAQENYVGGYIWIAPCLLIFNIAAIIASIVAVFAAKKIKTNN